MTLRATTNLVIPDHLQLPRTELKKNFMWLYNKGYVGPEPVMIARLWMSTVFPEITDDPSFGKSSKGIRAWAQYAAKYLRAGYLKIQKVNDANNPHFIVSLPLADMNPHAIHSVATQYRNWFTDGRNVDTLESAYTLTEQMKDAAEATEVKQRVIPAAEILKNMKTLDAKGRAELSQCLIQVRIAIKGSVAVVFADLKITQAEAQQLTTTPWMQIRPIDLYPLLLQWVAGQFGYTVSTPLASFPISKIARTLPLTKPEDARVNEDGLAIDAKGLPYWLPKELNNTTRYEDLYSQVGDKGDGTFSLLDVAAVSATLTIGEEVKIKLPANIPVLIDWTNNKYAFSLSTGMLKILDLSRYKAADASHIRTLLKNTQLTDKYLAQVTSLATASGVQPKVQFLPNELAAISNEDASVADKMSDRNGVPMEDYLETAILYFGTHVNPEIKFRDISTEGDPIFRPLARYMKLAYAAILNNLDAVNTRFAVSTVSSVLGNLILIAKYASDSAPIELAANKLCFAAANQNVKEDWEPPSIPLLSDKIGFLPHQKKVRNLLKDSPDFAILPVQAGGGKSVLIITDILYEIKADRNQPYLILCPSHLVAQYVKEIVFFTSGKLNVVPINTDVIFRNGISRLTKLLEGAPRNTVVVCNYDVLAKSPQQICYGTSPVTVYPVIEFLRQFRFGYAALDESHCFVAGTKVDTTEGVRNIEDITVGDYVLSALGNQRVEATHALPMNTDVVQLTYNGETQTCTTKHPFFTSRGWVQAQYLVAGDMLVTQAFSEELINEEIDLRELQPEICAKESSDYQPAVLRNLLRGEMADVSTEDTGKNSYGGEPQENRGNLQGTQSCESRSCGSQEQSNEYSHEGNQSDARPTNSDEVESNFAENGAHLHDTWRERNRSEQVRTDSNGHVSKGSASVGSTIETSCGVRICNELQDRLGVAETEAGSRDSGSFPQAEGTRDLGREEKGCTNFVRLESITHIQQSDYEASRGSQKVYNLQVAGHPSYSVNGVLVHNSVKNDSQRTRACMTLIADIPKKRLASGTMAHDSPSDLAMQISMLDPTLFGSRDAFNARYGQEVKGNRVVKWRPGAQQAIMTVIKSRVVIGKAMRKEWAALLPQAEEKFHGVEMTETQHQVYTAILTEALDKMKADAKGNKTLQKFFESQGTAVMPAKPQAGGDEGEDEEADEEAEDSADENAGAGIEAMLKFYLARLEQFLTAPVADALGDKLLKGDDRRSPKVNMIIKIMYEHVKADLPGKVLVFTNFIASAEAIYEALPPDLKRMALLYVAADKETTGSQFETDDSKKIMIGVENSMNTGLNLQHVSRLIRVETVWNPGTLEQGNSRVQRPELKKAERREKIYFDWVVANRTMDVTKISRLIAKVIAVGKFENADSEDYEAIPDVPIIPMNSETIQAMNDWNLNLVEYADAYKEYKQVQHADYTEYREIHGALSLEPITVAAPPLDAKILASVPYPLGLELYKAGELGLIRVDEYLRQDFVEDEEASPTEDDEGEGAEDAVNVQKQRLKEAYRSLIGHTVHTEFGDGIVKSVGVHGKYVNVLLPSGFLVRTKIAACFLVTKPQKNTRAALIKAVGLPSVDPVAGIPGARFRIDNAGARRAAKLAEEEAKEEKKVKITKKTSELSVELTFNVSNGFLGITYFADKKNPDAKAALQALGFRPVPEFALAHVKNALQLRKQFNIWHEAGFTLDETYRKMNVSAAFLDMYNLLKSGKLTRGTENFKFSTRNQLANFFRTEVKPSTSRNAFKPFPMIEDGEAYIVMHLRGQPANVKATKVRSPGIRWQEGGESLVFYGLDLGATGQKIKEIMAAGIQIANEDEVRKHFRLLKKTKLRTGEPDKTLSM